MRRLLARRRIDLAPLAAPRWWWAAHARRCRLIPARRRPTSAARPAAAHRAGRSRHDHRRRRRHRHGEPGASGAGRQPALRPDPRIVRRLQHPRHGRPAGRAAGHRTIEARRAAAEADVHRPPPRSRWSPAPRPSAPMADAAQAARADRGRARGDPERRGAACATPNASSRRTRELRARGVGAERDALRAQLRGRARCAPMSPGARRPAAQPEAPPVRRGRAAHRPRAGRGRRGRARAEGRAAAPGRGGPRQRHHPRADRRHRDLAQRRHRPDRRGSLQAPMLFQIAANLDEMEVWATVDEADIGRIRAGPGRDLHRRRLSRREPARRG